MQAQHFVAHRGWRQPYPENTLLAFLQAIGAGAVNLELDVQLSADGVAFAFHDAGLERLCGQRGNIWDYTANELQQFTAHEPSRLGSRFADSPDVGLCPLHEVAKLLTAHSGVNCFVELKVESLVQFDVGTVYTAVASALHGVEDRCVLISFELDALLYAKAQGWQRHAPVFDQWPDWQLASLWQLQPEVVFCDRTIVPGDIDLRSLPWPALIYEVSTATDARYWFDRGAAAVETFHIGELLEEFGLA